MTTNARLPSLIAAALLLAASGAAASDEPTQCTTNGGGWTVSASDPFDATPCPVDRCTGITYNITPHRGEIPDHVALIVEHDAPIVVPSSNFITAPCAGDNVTGLAFRDCSSQTARINQNQQKVGPFDLVVTGALQPIGASIVVKKGKVAEQCRIASLGSLPDGFDPHGQVTSSETIEFKGCKLTIPKDKDTLEALPATVEGEGCVLVANGVPVNALSVSINGQPIGDGSWIKDGSAFSSGNESCTTRTVSGRLYTCCDCKSTTDPKPPCP